MSTKPVVILQYGDESIADLLAGMLEVNGINTIRVNTYDSPDRIDRIDCDQHLYNVINHANMIYNYIDGCDRLYLALYNKNCLTYDAVYHYVIYALRKSIPVYLAIKDSVYMIELECLLSNKNEGGF